MRIFSSFSLIAVVAGVMTGCGASLLPIQSVLEDGEEGGRDGRSAEEECGG